MLKNLIRKQIFVVMAALVLAVPALADQISEITKEKADVAVALLKTKAKIAHFCAPCSDTAAKFEDIQTVTAIKTETPAPAGESSHPNLWEVKVNKYSLDFAYVYFPMDNGQWKNLGLYLKLPVDGVPLIMPASAAGVQDDDPAPPTPLPTPKPQAQPQPPPSRMLANGWRPVVEMDNNIFPSFFLATATQERPESRVEGVKGDGAGKIGIHIINPAPNTKIKVGIEIGDIVSYQEFETELGIKDKYYQIYPFITWNWEALKKYKKPAPANAVFTVYVNGKLYDKKTTVIRIRSINEAVYAYSYLLDDERWASTKWVFAAYVDEDNEWVDQILKEALKYKLVDNFSGYQGSEKDVINQVLAVWITLQMRGFKYSSITNTSGTGTSQKVYSQYVRLFKDAVNAAQANCVDGSVLIASVLKKIGIRVGLVLMPGHCYLVFDLTGKGDWRGLETTMMGNVDLDAYPDGKSKYNAAVQGFADAVSVGNQRWADAIQKMKSGDPAYQLIDIEEARRYGIAPVDW